MVVVVLLLLLLLWWWWCCCCCCCCCCVAAAVVAAAAVAGGGSVARYFYDVCWTPSVSASRLRTRWRGITMPSRTKMTDITTTPLQARQLYGRFILWENGELKRILVYSLFPAFLPPLLRCCSWSLHFVFALLFSIPFLLLFFLYIFFLQLFQ